MLAVFLFLRFQATLNHPNLRAPALSQFQQRRTQAGGNEQNELATTRICSSDAPHRHCPVNMRLVACTVRMPSLLGRVKDSTLPAFSRPGASTECSFLHVAKADAVFASEKHGHKAMSRIAQRNENTEPDFLGKTKSICDCLSYVHISQGNS